MWIPKASPRTEAANFMGGTPPSKSSPVDRATVAREFASWVKSELGDRVERIVLFGSVARGDDRPTSDIDLLIEVRGDPVEVRRAVGPRILEVASETGYFISAFVEPATDAAKGIGIHRTIQREGRILG